MRTPAARLGSALVMGSAAAFTLPSVCAQGTDPVGDGLSAMQRGTISAAYATSRDVGSRLYRHRAGIRPVTRYVETPAPAAPAADSKGGLVSAKDAKVAAVSTPVPSRWEVFGSLFYYSEDHDDFAYCGCIGPKEGRSRRGWFLDTSTTTDTFGGTAGIEYHVNRNWSLGIGVGAARTEIKMGALGSSDLDTLSLSPYVSYYLTDALGSADLWASAMYSYGMHSHDILRSTGVGYATSSPDADTHTIEVVAGLNYGDDDFVHGPYAGLRWITGGIDSYNEIGPGGLFVPEQDLDSLVSILGYQASWLWRQGGGYWVPQLRAAWEHEFEEGDASFYGIPLQEGDSDFAVLGAGIGYWWDSGWHLGLDYEGRFGDDTQSHWGGVNAGKSF